MCSAISWADAWLGHGWIVRKEHSYIPLERRLYCLRASISKHTLSVGCFVNDHGNALGQAKL
jgi:hypothetical protein